MLDLDNAALNAAAADWVATLRATEAGQARGYLRNEDTPGAPSFCCLGIACDISGLGVWGAPTGGADAYMAVGVAAYHAGKEAAYPHDDGVTGSLPAPVMLGLGLRTRLGDFLVTDSWLAQLRLDYPATAARMEQYLSEGHWVPGSYQSAPPPDVIGAASLSSLNDWGMEFGEIADVIESQPAELFGQPDFRR